jgi:outer membrane autotransporter protein
MSTHNLSPIRWALIIASIHISGNLIAQTYSGPFLETNQQTLSGSPLTVVLEDDYSLVTSDSNAFRLIGTAGVSFTQLGLTGTGGALQSTNETLFVDNSGGGNVSITATGLVTSDNATAIRVVNSADSESLSITADTLNGREAGILASNRGTGAVEITVFGDIITAPVAIGTNDDGIFSRNFNGTFTRIETFGNIVGGDDGIDASNRGSGDLTIIARGEVRGLQDNGITGTSASLTGDVSIVAEAEVFGATRGIQSFNNNTDSTGTIRVTAKETVSSLGDFGIRTSHEGDGDSFVTAERLVSADGLWGIFSNSFGEGNITVDAQEGATAGGFGIDLRNEVGGDIKLSADGPVSGNDFSGINIINSGGNVELDIFGPVSSANAHGIAVDNLNGSGETFLTVHDGADISGAVSGIGLSQTNGERLKVDVNGTVQSGSDGAIVNGTFYSFDYGSQGIELTVGETGVLGNPGSGDYAFVDNAVTGPGINADSNLTVAGTLNGDLLLGQGDDMVTILATALLEADIILDGDNYIPATGTAILDNGTDRIIFDGGGRSLFSDQFVNVDEVFLTGGADLALFDRPGAPNNLRTFIIQADAGSTAFFSDDYLIEGNSNNLGLFDLSTLAPAPGTRLSVELNYTAAGGLLVDADLSWDGGPDNSPLTDASFTDQLLVAGNIAGATKVTVVNTGPTITSTDTNNNGIVDPGEGLLFAQAEGTATDASFSLGGGAVSDGLYVTDIYSFAPSVSQSGFWDFVLASSFAPAATAYESLPIALFGLTGVDTLEQRVGERGWIFGPAPQESFDRGVWIRVAGGQYEANPDSTTGSGYDLDVWKVQTGMDILVGDHANGDLHAGIFGYRGEAQLDAHSRSSSARIKTEGAGIGVSLIWYGNNGLYADAVALFHDFETDLESSALGSIAEDVDGSGTTLSMEIGRHYRMAEDWALIPQAQLAWAEADFDDFVGPVGERVSAEALQSITLRLGLAAERAWEHSATRGSSAYVIANIIHEFEDATVAEVNGVGLASGLAEWTAEAGLGATHTWQDGRFALFGEASLVEAFDSADSSGIQGTLGFRAHF